LSTFHNGLRAYTFDGTTFTNVGSINDGCHGLGVLGDGVYIYQADAAGGMGVYTFNGSDFTNVGHIDNGSFAHNVWGDGTYIYLADGAAGLKAYGFNGTSFVEAAKIDNGGKAFGVWGDGTYIYLANWNDGLRAYKWGCVSRGSSSSSSISSSSSTECAKLFADTYRFSGFRYGFRGPSHMGPSDIIPEIVGLYAFPRSSSRPHKGRYCECADPDLEGSGSPPNLLI